MGVLIYVKKLISILNEQGTKKEDGLNCFAIAETKKKLTDLGYQPVEEIDESDIRQKYLGVKLTGKVICYAACDDLGKLTCNGYDSGDDIKFMIMHGAHLWKKSYGYDKLVKPFGY